MTMTTNAAGLLAASYSAGNGDPVAIGFARSAAPTLRDGFFYFTTQEKLPHLRYADLTTNYLGQTSQGDSLHAISVEEVERLRALNAERATAKAAHPADAPPANPEDAAITVVVVSRKTDRHTDGADVSLVVDVAVPGHSAVRLVCRRIADFGGVINPPDGGILSGGIWDRDGKGNGRAATPAELAAVAYLGRNWPL